MRVTSDSAEDALVGRDRAAAWERDLEGARRRMRASSAPVDSFVALLALSDRVRAAGLLSSARMHMSHMRHSMTVSVTLSRVSLRDAQSGRVAHSHTCCRKHERTGCACVGWLNALTRPAALCGGCVCAAMGVCAAVRAAHTAAAGAHARCQSSWSDCTPWELHLVPVLSLRVRATCLLNAEAALLA